MKWSAEFSQVAERDLAILTKSVRLQILERVAWFTEHFDASNPLPLHHEWRGFYKLRVNDYRVVYKIQHDTRVVRIEYVDHRSRAYKRKLK